MEQPKELDFRLFIVSVVVVLLLMTVMCGGLAAQSLILGW